MARGLTSYAGNTGSIVAHADLASPESFAYIQDDRSALASLDILRKNARKVGFLGHTHVQEVFSDPAGELEWLGDHQFRVPAGLACVVMVGAVGQPRHEADRRACWVMWDSDEIIVEFRKTDYDRLAAAKSITDVGLPQESALRLLKDEEIEGFGRIFI